VSFTVANRSAFMMAQTGPSFGAYEVSTLSDNSRVSLPWISAPAHYKGAAVATVFLEVIPSSTGEATILDEKNMVSIPLSKDAYGRWVVSPEVAAQHKNTLSNHNNLYTRFKLFDANNEPLGVIVDQDRTRFVPTTGTAAASPFNFIPSLAVNPQGKGPAVLAIADTLLTGPQYADFKAAGKRVDHFTKVGGQLSPESPFIDLMHHYGIKEVQFRPIIGGDKLSLHGYWTQNTFQLGGAVPNYQIFHQTLAAYYDKGMQMAFDGAFVNEGVNGVHSMANILHGNQSHYLDFFRYPTLNGFPNKRMVMGFLPTIRLNHKDEIDFNAFDIELLADGPSNGPKYVHLKALKQFNEDGTPKILTDSQMSVQDYSFPISDEEYHEKKIAFDKLDKDTALSPTARKKQKLFFKQFELGTSAQDNSGYKWSGQRDIAWLNIQNPDTTRYIIDGFKHWTQFVDRSLTAHGSVQLGAQTIQPAFMQTLKRAQTPAEKATAALALIQANTTPLGSSQARVFPAWINHSDFDPVNLHTLQEAYTSYEKQKSLLKTRSASHILVEDLQKNFALESLPVPAMVQTVTANPKLKQLLEKGTLNWFKAALGYPAWPFTKAYDWLMQTQVTAQLEKWMRNPSFYEQLNTKLAPHMSESLRTLMRDPVTGPLFTEDFGRSVFLSLLRMGDTPILPSQRAIQQDSFKDQIYAHNEFWKDVPTAGIRKQRDALVRRLSQLNLGKITEDFETLYRGISPETAFLTQFVNRQRRHGLNWRIDAMKDFGDMDRIKNLPDAQKNKAYVQEMNRIVDLFRHIHETLLPYRTTMIGEFTDFGSITHHLDYNTQSLPLFQHIFRGNKIDIVPTGLKTNKVVVTHEYSNGPILAAMPNYNFLYSALPGVVGLVQSPANEYDKEYTPYNFLQGRLQPMLTQYDAPNVANFENMTSNHDKSTTLFHEVLNNWLWSMDHTQWLGFYDNDKQGVIPFVLREALSKKATQFLFTPTEKTALVELFALLKDESFRKALPAEALGKPSDKPLSEAEKRVALTAVFNALKNPDETLQKILSTSPSITTHAPRLEAVLMQLVTEPSEYKAVRGALSNSFAKAVKHYDSLFKYYNTGLNPLQNIIDVCNALPKVTSSTAESQYIQNSSAAHFYHYVGTALDKALWSLYTDPTLAANNKRWLGHCNLAEILDMALKRVPQFIQAPEGSSNEQIRQTGQLQSLLSQPATQEALKLITLHTAIEPAMERYKRIAALSIALPGTPSFYLPDLLGDLDAQGGEAEKNKFLGTRSALNLDKAQTAIPWRSQKNMQTMLQNRYIQELQPYIKLREQLPVLTNGFTRHPNYENLETTEKNIYTDHLNRTQLLPILRDDGRNQVLTLTYTGSPGYLSHNGTQTNATGSHWWFNETDPTHSLDGAFYPEVQSSTWNGETRRVDTQNKREFKGLPHVPESHLWVDHMGLDEGVVYQAVGPESQDPRQPKHFITHTISGRLCLLPYDAETGTIEPTKPWSVHIMRTLLRVPPKAA
jgi:hypothetical protein